jgi:hypothetical protein
VLRLTKDSILVRIDSGVVVVPGPDMTAPPPAIAGVTLAALVGVRSEKKWSALVESTPVSLVDTLRWSDRRRVKRVDFRMPRPPDLLPSSAFLLLRFGGTALRRDGAPPVETYVCDEKSLAGESAASRSRVSTQRVSYLDAC